MPANPDATNPSHYTRLDPEPITVIERWGLDFCLGNALKYIARAGHKPGVDGAEDLAKAAWYLDRARRGCGDVPVSDSLTLVSRAHLDGLAAQLDHAHATIAELQTEVQRGELVARVAGDRIRELETLRIEAGLAEVVDSARPALATHAMGCRCPQCIAERFDLGGGAGE